MEVEKSKLLATLTTGKAKKNPKKNKKHIASAANQKAPVCRSVGADGCFLAIKEIHRNTSLFNEFNNPEKYRKSFTIGVTIHQQDDQWQYILLRALLL